MQTHRVICQDGWFLPQHRRWFRWHNYYAACIDAGGHWDETVAFKTEPEAWHHISLYSQSYAHSPTPRP